MSTDYKPTEAEQCVFTIELLFQTWKKNKKKRLLLSRLARLLSQKQIKDWTEVERWGGWMAEQMAQLLLLFFKYKVKKKKSCVREGGGRTRVCE